MQLSHMQLSHWLSRFFSQIRHHVVPIGNVIPRRRRSRRADISQPLEVRCLLSAVANDDTAQVKGKIAINLNVLFNDTSPVGGLRITGVGTTSAGTVSLFDSNDDGRNDQIIFTPSSTFSGWTTFTYTVADSAGATDSGSVSVEVISNVGMVGSNTSGQLGVVGGLGGNGYQPSPTSGYTPNTLGNYTTTEVVNDPTWNNPVPMGDGNATGTGSQTLTNTVVSTYIDSNNWSYSETITWVYDLWAFSGSDYNHIWGGYTQVFSASLQSGVKTTALDFNSSDNTQSSISTTSPAGSYVEVGGGIDTYVFRVSHTDNPTGLDSGSSSETKMSSFGYTGTGLYGYSTPGGYVSGTLSGSNTKTQSSSYSIGLNETALGGWIGGGITAFNGNSSKSNSWTGSGTYGYTNFSGTVTDDSGSKSESFTYMGGGIMLPDMSWSLMGTGSSSGSSSHNFAYNGTGTYSSSASGIAKGGVTSENGGNNSSLQYGVTYSLSSGDWIATAGSGSGGGGYTSYSDYSGSGTYSRNEQGGTISGKLNEDGHTNSWSNYGYSTVLNSGKWTATGQGKTGTDGHTHFDSSGSGGFSVSEGGSGPVWSQVNGVTQESSRADTSYLSNEYWLLDSDGWQRQSGSGSASDSGRSDSDSSGSGSYGDSGVDTDGTVYSINGSITRSDRGQYTEYQRQTKSSLQNGVWSVDSGTSNHSGGNYEYVDSVGTGTYSKTGLLGSAISGTLNQSANTQDKTDWVTTANWSPTGWTTSGTASNSGDVRKDYSYSGTGTFATAEYSGTVSETGGQKYESKSDMTYDYVEPLAPSSGSVPDPDHSAWNAKSGNNWQSDKSWDRQAYAGSGGYSDSGVDSAYGYWSVNGITEFGGAQSISNESKSHTQFVSGAWESVSGEGAASGSASQSRSYFGTGTYSYSAGAATLSGPVVASGGSFEGSTWSSKSAMKAGAAITSGSGDVSPWSTEGSASGSSKSERSVSFIVSQGSYEYGTTTGSVYRKSDSVSNSDYTLDSKGDWNQTKGNATYSISDGFQRSYSGGGTYSQSGDMTGDSYLDDIGDWSFNGAFTESGGYYSGNGSFVKESWDGTEGKWIETDFGASASHGTHSSYDYSGSGAYTAGPLTGSYTRSGGTRSKEDVVVTDGVTSGIVGTAKQKYSQYSTESWSDSGTLTLRGTTGGYSGGGGNSSNSNWNLDWTLDPVDEDWDATSGKSHSSSMESSYGHFSGTGTYMNVGTAKYNAGGSGSLTKTSDFDFNPNAASGPNGDPPQYWERSSGSETRLGTAYDSYHASATVAYLVHGVSGSRYVHDDSDWNVTANSVSTYNAAGDGKASGWTSSGSAVEQSFYSVGNSYSASGATVDGTYEESGQYSKHANSTINSTLADIGWSSSGSGNAGEFLNKHYLHVRTTPYSSTDATGTVNGTKYTSAEETEFWGYAVDYDLHHNSSTQSDFWKASNGMGQGGVYSTTIASESASGTYSVAYADNTQVATGTQKMFQSSKWESKYEETYTLNPVSLAWFVSGSGSANGSGSASSEYSASGTWGSAAKGGSLTVSGSSNSDWIAKGTWTDQEGSLVATVQSSGAGVADSTEKTWHLISKTTSDVLPIGNGGTMTYTSTTNGSGSTEDTFHEDTKYDWQKAWSGGEWSKSESGSRTGYWDKTSQYDSKSSWTQLSVEPNSTYSQTGYSSAASYNHGKDTWNLGHSGTSKSDGSSTFTYTHSQSFSTDWKTSGEHSQSWTHTWSYPSMSGWGGGYTTTSSGSSYSKWSSSGSSNTSWSYTWTIVTPASVTGGSSSGGGGGTSGGGGGGGDDGGYGGGGPPGVPEIGNEPGGERDGTDPVLPRMTDLQFVDVTIPDRDGPGHHWVPYSKFTDKAWLKSVKGKITQEAIDFWNQYLTNPPYTHGLDSWVFEGNEYTHPKYNKGVMELLSLVGKHHRGMIDEGMAKKIADYLRTGEGLEEIIPNEAARTAFEASDHFDNIKGWRNGFLNSIAEADAHAQYAKSKGITLTKKELKAIAQKRNRGIEHENLTKQARDLMTELDAKPSKYAALLKKGAKTASALLRGIAIIGFVLTGEALYAGYNGQGPVHHDEDGNEVTLDGLLGLLDAAAYENMMGKDVEWATRKFYDSAGNLLGFPAANGVSPQMRRARSQGFEGPPGEPLLPPK